MKRIWKWLVPLTLSVFVLSVPMVAGAALTPPSLTGYGGPSWLSTITDTPGDVSTAANDIVAAYQGYDVTNYYFQVKMTRMNGGQHADYFVLHIGSLSFTATYGSPFSQNPALTANDAFATSTGTPGYLEWKFNAADHPTIGPGSTWYVEAFTGGSLVDTAGNASVATPIPNAAWLLGSGIIGLIGLRRRRARKA